MGKYIIKRVLMAVLTLFIVICLTFFLMNAVPGSPWLSERTPSQATIDALNAKYGLDKPVIVQLGLYRAKVVSGAVVVAKLYWVKQNACPRSGPCCFIRTPASKAALDTRTRTWFR